VPLPRIPEKDAHALIDAVLRLKEPQFPWNAGEVVVRLDHPSIRSRVHELLGDRSQRVSVRELLLELGTSLAAAEFVDDALGIALRGDEEVRLRADAAYTIRAHGEAAHVEQLRPLAALSGSADEGEQRLGAIALTALVERELMTVLEAASQALPPSKGLRDVRSSLYGVLKRRLSASDGRAVLGRLSGRLPNEGPALPERALRKLSDASLHKIESDDAPWDQGLANDVSHLIRVGRLRFEQRIEPIIEARLARDPVARELLYRASLPERPHYIIRNALTNNDADWLLRLADELGAQLPEHVGKEFDHLLWWLPAHFAERDRRDRSIVITGIAAS
jgi:hypothetical protein